MQKRTHRKDNTLPMDKIRQCASDKGLACLLSFRAIKRQLVHLMDRLILDYGEQTLKQVMAALVMRSLGDERLSPTVTDWAISVDTSGVTALPQKHECNLIILNECAWYLIDREFDAAKGEGRYIDIS